MSFGDCADDASLLAGWKQFCRQLEQAGEDAFKDANPALALHRADAFRFLTQNLGQAFDLAYETRDSRHPVIHTFCKLGGDNANYVYQQAWIDGNSVYRISGNRGTARFFNIAVQGHRPVSKPDQPGWRNLHEPFGDTPEANQFGHQLETAWDGGFELYIGGAQPGPNWLPTTPRTRKLFIRQGFDEWTETPATIRIERIGMAEPKPVPTPTDMIEAMDWAGNFLTTMMRDNADSVYEFAEDIDPEQVNHFPTGRRETHNPVYNAEKDRCAAGRSMRCAGNSRPTRR
jgi:hypothetical protein